MKRHPHAPPRLQPADTFAVEVLPGQVALTTEQLERMADEYLDYILEEDSPLSPRQDDEAA